MCGQSAMDKMLCQEQTEKQGGVHRGENSSGKVIFMEYRFFDDGHFSSPDFLSLSLRKNPDHGFHDFAVQTISKLKKWRTGSTLLTCCFLDSVVILHSVRRPYTASFPNSLFAKFPKERFEGDFPSFRSAIETTKSYLTVDIFGACLTVWRKGKFSLKGFCNSTLKNNSLTRLLTTFSQERKYIPRIS